MSKPQFPFNTVLELASIASESSERNIKAFQTATNSNNPVERYWELLINTYMQVRETKAVPKT